MNIAALERQVADDLARSFEQSPSQWSWRDSECQLIRGPGGIVMSARYFTIYQPNTVNFGFWNRRRIKRAFRAWKSALGNELAVSEHLKALLALRRCLIEPLRMAA